MKSWVGIGLALLGCQREPAPLPAWWENTPGGQSRFSLIGRGLQSIDSVEKGGAYYRDTLGRVFRYQTPEGGTLWIEYYIDPKGTVRTIAYTVEQEDFSALARLYQLLRGVYTERYGAPTGPIGAQTWSIGDSLRLFLRLSPERRYLHCALASL
ncbi:MAG: hypothetical protein N2170_04870 [Bacteroidia bacterium]|nr:hypothetical protein [Bacteroidia bacterium]